MRRSVLVFLLFASTLHTGFAQSIPVLVAGAHDFPDSVPGFNNVLLRFEGGGMQVFSTDLHMDFESTSAAIADEQGQVLFYTNGCTVANNAGDTLFNGAGLNPGEIADIACPQTGYLCPKGAMILPWPGDPGRYCLLHLGARYATSRKLTYGPLYYSVVDMDAQSGAGAVTSKNNPLFDGDLEPFTVVRHGNGRDWWIVMPVYGTNQHHLYLLSPQGITALPVQSVGPIMSCKRIGSSAFSPNGLRYGRQQNCRTVVMDFDRCTGVFSGPITLSTPAYSFGGGGIGFSPDGRRIFTTNHVTVLTADLTQPSPAFDTLVHTYNYTNWGPTMSLIQQTADNELLISNMARQNYMGRIVMPTPDGATATYEYKGVPLPDFIMRTTPNEPNRRLGDWSGSPCDTLGINPTTETVPAGRPRVALEPNPAHDQFMLHDYSPEVGTERQLYLYSVTGALLLQQVVPAGSPERTVAIPGFLPGLYFWELRWNDGNRVAGRLLVE